MESSLKLDGRYEPASVPAPTGNDVFYYQDPLVAFLRLKVTKSHRTWVYDRCVYGMHLKRQIGKVDAIGLTEARRIAYDWDAQIAEGKAPPTRTERQEKGASRLKTVREVWNYYVSNHLKEKSSCKRVEDSVKLHWKSIFDTKLNTVDNELVRSWLQKIASSAGKPTANKHLVTIKAALNFCRGDGVVKFDMDIFRGVKPYKELERTVYLKSSEMPAMIAALDKQSEAVRHAVLLLIYTCQRKSNVLQMEWREIDLEAGVWTIPPIKTKTEKPYSVQLTPKALDILYARAEKNKVGFVFPPCRKGQATHLTNVNTAWSQIKVDAGVPHLRIHDLRHSGLTWLALAGANAYQIQRAGNHASVKSSQRYVNLVSSDVRDILARSQSPGATSDSGRGSTARGSA